MGIKWRLFGISTTFVPAIRGPTAICRSRPITSLRRASPVLFEQRPRFRQLHKHTAPGHAAPMTGTSTGRGMPRRCRRVRVPRAMWSALDTRGISPEIFGPGSARRIPKDAGDIERGPVLTVDPIIWLASTPTTTASSTPGGKPRGPSHPGRGEPHERVIRLGFADAHTQI